MSHFDPSNKALRITEHDRMHEVREHADSQAAELRELAASPAHGTSARAGGPVILVTRFGDVRSYRLAP